MDVRATKLVVRDVLTDRRFHERWSGEIEPRSLGHQHRVAEHRQVGAAGHAVAHDRGVLRYAFRRNHGVVAEDPAEIVFIREDLVLQGEENARRIDEVDERQPVRSSDRLGPQDLFDGHGKAGASLHGRVIGDDDRAAAVDRADRHDHARAGAPPHCSYISNAAQRPSSRQGGVRVEQETDSLPRRFSPLGVLPTDRLGPTPLAQELFTGLDLDRRGQEPACCRPLKTG